MLANDAYGSAVDCVQKLIMYQTVSIQAAFSEHCLVNSVYQFDLLLKWLVCVPNAGMYQMARCIQ